MHRDTADTNPQDGCWSGTAGRWSDYDGSSIHDGDSLYGDYAVNMVNNEAVATETMSYLPGIGEKDLANGAIVYYHSDQVGSLRVATDATGNTLARFVYSAFGELIHEDNGGQSPPTVNTRYKWCGAFQYETGLGADSGGGGALPFTRIGHRWYDPSTGRFIQRDPIGIKGGLNTYVYCGNNPVSGIDPSGEWFMLLGWILAGAPAVITTVAMAVDLIWGIARHYGKAGREPEVIRRIGMQGLNSVPEDVDENVPLPGKLLPPIRPFSGGGPRGGRLGPLPPIRPNFGPCR